MRIFFCLLLLQSLFLLTLAAQPPDAKPGTASVAGRVTRGEKPLAGILVTASRSNSYNGWQSNGTAVKTDDEGRYQFTNLAAGQYIITPRALADVMPGNVASGLGKPVFVQDGEASENLDFSLVKGGVITGTVTDENGKPLINARVRLLTKSDRGSFPYYNATLNYLMDGTDDRGVYRLFGLPPGKYLVSVGGEQDNTSAQRRYGGTYYPQTFYPGVTSEAEAKIVEVTGDSESTEVDIRFGKAEKTFTVRGRVIDAVTGTPLVGVAMGYTKKTPNGNYGTSGLDRTNLQGEFQITGLGPGSYTAYQSPEEGLTYYTEPKKFEISTTDVNDLEIKASLGSSLSGMVVVEGTKDASLLAEVQKVTIFLSSDAGQEPISTRIVLNPDNSFRVTGIRPGNIRFNMGQSGTPPKARAFIIRIEKDGKAWPDRVPLAASENAANVRIIIGYGLGVLRGQLNVTGGQLADVGQLQVALHSRGAARESRNVIVDAKGRFYIEGLLPGEYQIVAVANPLPGSGKRPKPPVSQSVTVMGDKETQVTVTLDLTEEEK